MWAKPPMQIAQTRQEALLSPSTGKAYSNPGKERSKIQKKVKKAEEDLAVKEAKLDELKAKSHEAGVSVKLLKAHGNPKRDRRSRGRNPY